MTKRKVKAPPAAKPRSSKAAKPPARKADDAGIDWDRIRADYEIGARKLGAIALEHGITPQKSQRARGLTTGRNGPRSCRRHSRVRAATCPRTPRRWQRG